MPGVPGPSTSLLLSFKLGLEAYRIRLAHLFGPIEALETDDRWQDRYTSSIPPIDLAPAAIGPAWPYSPSVRTREDHARG